MLCEPIGFVRSAVTDGVDLGWGNVDSEITVYDEYRDGLLGLDEFSHALIIFYMHKSSFDPVKDLIRKPQGRRDMPLVGIFAQRAKHRPNPIGVTAVELLEVKGGNVKVRGLDAIDGTPVLDIKPYFPYYDSRDSSTPSWVDELMRGYF